MAENRSGRLIQPPNPLKAKVGIGGPGAVNPETLERAEQVIANLADNYLEWVESDLVKLQEAFANLTSEPMKQRENLAAVFEICHDIKGQGGSFGYQLMTTIGHQLCQFLEDRESAGPEEVEAVRLHVDALKLVIAKRMKGDGGAEGVALLTGLQKVVTKLAG